MKNIINELKNHKNRWENIELGFFDILQATCSLIFVVITIIVGLKIFLKYFVTKKKEFILIGLFWIGLTTPWLPTVFIFFMFLLSIPSSVNYFVILNIAFLPITVIIGFAGFSRLLSMKKRNLNLAWAIIIIPNVLFEILFFYFFFTDLSFIVTFPHPLYVKWTLFAQIYFIYALSVFMWTLAIFSRQCLISDIPEVRLKGKILLVSFISFTIGGIIEALFHLEPIGLVIARLIMASASIEFYTGFILPKSAKKLFLKEK